MGGSYRKVKAGSPKYYFNDTGVLRIMSINQKIGYMAENAVFLELKRRAYLDPFLEVYYWKSLADEEVDFVVKEDTKIRELIQVCWSVADINTKKRETKALLKAMDEFKLKRGLIITEDFEGEEDYDGRKIQYVSLRRWLLGL